MPSFFQERLPRVRLFLTEFNDSKFMDSSVLLRKLLPLYGVQKSIAIMEAGNHWVNDNEGLTGKGLKGRGY